MVFYRSKMHATLKCNYQLIPALKWLRLLMNHIPDKYEHLVRYYGYYSNRPRGARKLTEQDDDIVLALIPLGIVLLAIALWAFFWAVGNGQFDDFESSVWRILLDDETKPGLTTENTENTE
jgi:cbb3-type cytochrome oxidase maturation protein